MLIMNDFYPGQNLAAFDKPCVLVCADLERREFLVYHGGSCYKRHATEYVFSQIDGGSEQAARPM